MSTAAVGVEGGGGAAEGGGGGGGQLGSIKSEGYGSQLAPAGLDCHLAQINREVSHSTEPSRLWEKTFGKYCLLLQMLRFWQALPCRQVASKLSPLDLVPTITWRRYTHTCHLERKWTKCLTQFLAALAALYLTLVSQWVAATFEF